MKIVNLNITSYIGLSIGAQHYYAKLEDWNRERRGDIELWFRLNISQAKRLNIARSDIGFRENLYAAGDMAHGFESQEHAIEFARSVWLEHFPEADFLVLGRSGYIEPKPILASRLPLGQHEELVAAVQVVIDKCEAISWFDDPNNDDLMDSYYDEWKKLLEDAEAQAS